MCWMGTFTDPVSPDGRGSPTRWPDALPRTRASFPATLPLSTTFICYYRGVSDHRYVLPYKHRICLELLLKFTNIHKVYKRLMKLCATTWFRYACLFPSLVADWRRQFALPDMARHHNLFYCGLYFLNHHMVFFPQHFLGLPPFAPVSHNSYYYGVVSDHRCSSITMS